MGRFDPKYPAEQREAILRATCDDGMSVPKAVKAAAEGKLYGLPPFVFNERTASDYAAKERNRRKGAALEAKRRGTPEERLDAWAETALNILEVNTERISRKRTLEPLDVQVLKEMGKVAREVRGLMRGIPLTTSGRDTKAKAAEAKAAQPKASPLTQELIGKMHEGAEAGEARAEADGAAQQPDTP